MTDFLANHLTDLLARQPHPAQSQPSSASVQGQSASPTTNRANKSKPITYSFSTNFGASHPRLGGASGGGGSPASPSSQKSSYFSPQQPPSSSKMSEESSLIFDMLGCKADQDRHRREESEGSGTSFSSTTTTSPQTHSSSPPEDGVAKPPTVFKSSVNKVQIPINDNRLSNQTQLEDLSADSLGPISSQQKRQDGGKGPLVVRPTFTSMISAPYDPHKQDLMPSVRRSSSNRTTQTASSSSQKRLRLVPVSDDGRRFKFVEDEDRNQGLVGATPLLLKDGSNRFAEVSSSGSEVGRGSGKGKVGGLPANPTSVNANSPTSIARANHGATDSTFPEAVATPIRLGNLDPEERRAFLLSNSNRRHQDEMTKDPNALPSPSGGTNSISTPTLSVPIQNTEDVVEVMRGRALQRGAGPTSHEELSSSLIGHLKQSPEAQQFGWEHPQMFMSGADVQSWIKGVVPSEEDSMQEEVDVSEMSQEQLDELQDTFDSLDLNEEGEPAWLERKRASEHAALSSAIVEEENDHPSSSTGNGNDSSSGSFGSNGSDALPPRQPSPNNLSFTTAPTSHATSTSSNVDHQAILKRGMRPKEMHQSNWNGGGSKARDQEMSRQGSSSSSNQLSSSASESSDPNKVPKLPTTLRMSVGDSTSSKPQKKTIVHASEFQSRPNVKLDGRSSSYNISEESSEDNHGLGLEPQKLDLQTKAQILDQFK